VPFVKEYALLLTNCTPCPQQLPATVLIFENRETGASPPQIYCIKMAFASSIPIFPNTEGKNLTDIYVKIFLNKYFFLEMQVKKIKCSRTLKSGFSDAVNVNQNSFEHGK
jgi:hypothetical protein